MTDPTLPTDSLDMDSALVGDLMRPSTLDSSLAQRISTDIREPVVFSQSFCRFSLDRKGFLSHQSKIAFSVIPAVANSFAYFPVSVGVNSLISRCVLKVGNRTIAETQEFGALQGYRSLFETGEENVEREQFLTQRLINHIPNYDAVSKNGELEHSSTNSASYGLYAGREGSGGTAPIDWEPNQIVRLNGTLPVESPVYSIFLGDLFDIFANQDLPLFMLDDEVHIELHFTPPKQKRCSLAVTLPAQTADQDYLIDQSEVRMIYDTIYYSGDAMEAFRAKADRDGGLTFNYLDYRLTRRTASTAGAFDNLTQAIGGAGRFVDKIIVRIANDDKDAERSLLNSYECQAPKAGEERSINLRYNDRFEFPIDRSNSSLLFSTMREAEGDVPFITRAEYGTEMTGAITENTFMGHVQKANLASKFNYLCLRPSREERVNNQGMDLIYKCPMATESLTLLIWIGLRKVATLKDGHFDCYFA